MELKDVIFLVFKTIDKSDLIKEFKENFTTQPEIQKLMYIFQERVAGLGFWTGNSHNPNLYNKERWIRFI